MFMEILAELGTDALRVKYLQQYKILIDPLGGSISTEVLKKGAFSFYLARAIASHIDLKKFSLINIGANIGTTCLNFHCLGIRQFLAIEPVRHNFDLLRDNLEQLKSDSDVQIFNAAIGMGNGLAEINLHPRSGGRHSFKTSFGGSTELVEIHQIDDLDLPPNPVLWIDTEGSEFDVLRGGIRTISEIQPPICMEITPSLGGEEMIDGIARILEPLGYNFFDADGHHANRLGELPAILTSRQTDVIALSRGY